MARVSFVIISHSHEVAKGVVDLATQMAPDVHFEIAAGDDTGALGTSMHKVENALDRALAQVHKPGDEECCRGVLLMCDLGSATMVAQTVLELRGNPKDSSVLEIMSLGVRHGEHVHVRAQGPDCDKALELARDMLEGGTH